MDNYINYYLKDDGHGKVMNIEYYMDKYYFFYVSVLTFLLIFSLTILKCLFFQLG